VIICNEVGGQQVAVFAGLGEHDYLVAGTPSGQEQYHSLLVRGQGAQWIQVHVIGEEKFQVRKHYEAVFHKLLAQKLLKGPVDMGSGRLGLPGLALNELFELVVRDSTEYSFVYRSWGWEGLPVKGLRFRETESKPFQGTVRTGYAIQMSSYIN